ncbi:MULTISPECIES: YciI family protein [unclassified Streptomyces]|uniref:YciI family protein n=1 Tax=unclassified Streptomyces TaxID=2593676 RepID=UPI000F4ED4A3|nr:MULTISPECIES: YciI family protein [unclassified Streptomyces]MDH6456370.1 ketosteroid isomerase-like protein [Streptomyces sp. SAI-119]MDH6501701.1 ketosteroid isomerase-like protein [Streptomyces sp. SAI-149]QUC59878.1 nuclear transport factor 2 family protein [Streptomyces sp. A2-16]
MKYMLLVCGDDTNDASGMAPVEPWVEELGDRRVRLHGHRLALPADAVTVRVRGGEVLRTDGPFAETKEYVAGFDVLECDSLEEAIEAAAKHPVATVGAMEVRPFWEDEDAEGEIRRLDAERTDAARAGDVDRVLACYAPDAQVVENGRHHQGVEELRKAWAATAPATREALESAVHVDESIAFGHALVRTGDDLLRVTTGYRNVGPRWLIVHEHVTEATS